MPYTIFCLGSNQQYKKNHHEEINSAFYDACDTQDKLILDGPKRLGGSYDPDLIHQNVIKAIQTIIPWLKRNQPDADGKYHINLTGFSRGAVTCLKIANVLQRKLRNFCDRNGNSMLDQIEVNIFAEDPVAGLTDKSDLDARVIPPIVKHYIAILQSDEVRRVFKPQDLSRIIIADPARTEVTFLPMLGNHTTSIILKGPAYQESPIILWNLKYHFLKSQGVLFKNDLLPLFAFKKGLATAELRKHLPIHPSSWHELLDYYAKAKISKTYLEKALRFDFLKLIDLPLPGKFRSFRFNHKEYVLDPFFLNQHERELFKKCYPKSFNYLFEKASKDRLDPENSGIHRDSPALYEELKRMRKTNPVLFATLVEKKKIKHNQAHSFTVCDLPEGVARFERCRLLHFLENQTTNNAEPLEAKLDLLEIKIKQLTFQYQRGKSVWMPFAERTEFWRAEKMRDEVRIILNHHNKEKSYDALIQCLQKHFKELKERGSKSELVFALQHLLQQEGYTYSILENRKSLFFILGCSIHFFGRCFVGIGIVTAFLISSIGEAFKSLGNRVWYWGMTRTTPLKKLMGRIASLTIGAPSIGLGSCLKILGFLPDWLGSKVKKIGDYLIKNGNAYQVNLNPRKENQSVHLAENESTKKVCKWLNIQSSISLREHDQKDPGIPHFVESASDQDEQNNRHSIQAIQSLVPS